MNDNNCKIEEYAGHMLLNIYKLNKIKRQTNTTNEFLINYFIRCCSKKRIKTRSKRSDIKWLLRNMNNYTVRYDFDRNYNAP